MIGISGLARSGKDTLARAISCFVKKELGKDVKFYSFARELRLDCEALFQKHLGCSAFSEDPNDKKIIRDILVAYGESMKKKHGKDIWVKRLEPLIEKDLQTGKIFPIITDVRFDFEAEWIQNARKGAVVHISRYKNSPPNSTEALNDPLVAAKADLCHCWPTFSEDIEGNASGHASIIWQMILESHGNLWTT
jgi:hypothetical protein